MQKFGDPEFLTHTQAAQLYTALIMRAASAEVLPLRFTAYGEALRDHLDELRLLYARQVRAKAPAAGSVGQPGTSPSDSFPGMDVLVRAIKDFQTSASRLDGKLDELSKRDGLPDAALAQLNERLGQVERAFLLTSGLAGRSWFKHAVYAPGVTTGYGAWPLPAVRQAMEEHQTDQIGQRAQETAAVILGAGAALDVAFEAARVAAGG